MKKHDSVRDATGRASGELSNQSSVNGNGAEKEESRRAEIDRRFRRRVTADRCSCENHLRPISRDLKPCLWEDLGLAAGGGRGCWNSQGRGDRQQGRAIPGAWLIIELGGGDDHTDSDVVLCCISCVHLCGL
jgi:hypothetical protein